MNYSNEELSHYEKLLQYTGALSNLFSDSDSPYMASRSVENIYCLAFSADNLGRSDCSADARYRRTGVGIKTFLHNNGYTMQKVAEFNKDSSSYRDLPTKELIHTISTLRNERISFTKRTYGMDQMIYHCVTRSPGTVSIFEEPMDTITLKKIKITNEKGNTIWFTDDKNEYNFSLSKSTLLKRFDFREKVPLLTFPVTIIEEPYLFLENMIAEKQNTYVTDELVMKNTKHADRGDERLDRPYIILPLYSSRGGIHVPERSGLNQWNARGRARHPDEVYIPIPSWIHKSFPHFFPNKDVPFELTLPDETTLQVKVCQEGRKALMSNPNRALGQWLLRDVLDLEEEELLTYERLEEVDTDSVILYKESDYSFSIDFLPLDSFETFEEQYK